MLRNTFKNTVQARAAIALLASLSPALFGANLYTQHNLVSDVPGMADQTDAHLVNPWGLTMSPTSPFWVANNHSGTSTLYNSAGQPFPAASPLVVTVPTPPAAQAAQNPQPSTPSGIVFNDTAGFTAGGGSPAPFILATEDGTISTLNSGANAVVMIDNSASGAQYTGLAIANSSAGPMLYAANFKAGTIDAFDANFAPVAAPGGFADPALPAGFAPFNIQRIGRKLYVTYALQDGQGQEGIAGPGNGFVNVFDFSGNLLGRLISNGSLNSPWGLALAPENFGDFSDALLVGNFGDGTINAYDSCSGAYLGTLNDANGQAISIPGLWALRFGNGHSGGDATMLYFTAGIPGSGSIEDHGLFGSIQAGTPPPSPALPPTAAINIQNFEFVPTPVSLAPRTQLTWTNEDSTGHTVISNNTIVVL